MSWAEVKKINSDLDKPLDTLAAEKTAALQGDISGAKEAVTSLLSDGTNGLAALRSILADSGYGLSALKTAVDAGNANLTDGTNGLAAIKSAVGTANSSLGNSTYGLSALLAKLGTIESKITNDHLTEAEMESLIKSYISNGDYPLDIVIDPKFGMKAVKARSHIAVTTLSNTKWTNIIEVNGTGLWFGALMHSWLSYQNASAQLIFQILLDNTVVDYYTVPRTRYDTSMAWGQIITDPADSTKKMCAPLYGVHSYKISTASTSQRRTVGTSNATMSEAQYIVDIGGNTSLDAGLEFRKFDTNLIVRAMYSGEAYSSDSIYEFNVGVRMINS